MTRSPSSIFFKQPTSSLHTIFGIYIFSKIIVFIFLLKSGRYLVPDEFSYAQLVCYLNLELVRPSQFSYYLSFGPTFIVPSQIFNLMGLNCLESLRLTNLILSLCTGFIFLAMIKKIRFFGKETRVRKATTNLLFILYLFWPSKFLWLTAGIREASIEFLVLFSVILLFKSIQTSTSKIDWYSMAGLFICLSLLNLTRWMLFVGVVMISILFTILYVKEAKRYILSVFLLTVLLSNFLLPSLLIKSYAFGYDRVISQKIRHIQIEIGNFKDNQFKTQLQNEKIRQLDDKIRKQQEERRFNKTIPLRSTTFPDPEESRFAKNIEARSQIPVKACKINGNFLINQLVCNIQHLPIGLYSIILRPNPFQDWYSLDTKLASLENLLFVLVLLVILSQLLIRGLTLIRMEQLGYALLFVGGSLLGLALYEGNVGTSFRHRSILVWALVLILFYLLSAKWGIEEKREKIFLRNS